LNRAIASADAVVRKSPKLAKALTEAKNVRQSRFADLGRPSEASQEWLYYLKALQESDLEETRRAFADAIVDINKELPRHPRY
jgi:hypothetical protein